jgi:uncharacterized membrane protein YeaQ/YmgE (transglycosylase-associated protein family)
LKPVPSPRAFGNIAPSSRKIPGKPVALLMVLGLLLCASVANLSAQLDNSSGSPAAAQNRISEEKQSLSIDKRVESAVEAVSAYIDKVRTENFPLFLAIYCGIAGACLGVLISVLGYRLSDPRDNYSQLLRWGSLLAMTCGGASAVLLALMKAPANLENKLAVLLMSIVSGGIAGWISAFLAFIAQRCRSWLLAKKEGRVLSQRIGRR